MKKRLFLLVLIGTATIIAYCRKKPYKQKVNSPEPRVTPSCEQDEVIIGQYQDMIAGMMQEFVSLCSIKRNNLEDGRLYLRGNLNPCILFFCPTRHVLCFVMNKQLLCHE